MCSDLASSSRIDRRCANSRSLGPIKVIRTTCSGADRQATSVCPCGALGPFSISWMPSSHRSASTRMRWEPTRKYSAPPCGQVTLGLVLSIPVDMLGPELSAEPATAGPGRTANNNGAASHAKWAGVTPCFLPGPVTQSDPSPFNRRVLAPRMCRRKPVNLIASLLQEHESVNVSSRLGRPGLRRFLIGFTCGAQYALIARYAGVHAVALRIHTRLPADARVGVKPCLLPTPDTDASRQLQGCISSAHAKRITHLLLPLTFRLSRHSVPLPSSMRFGNPQVDPITYHDSNRANVPFLSRSSSRTAASVTISTSAGSTSRAWPRLQCAARRRAFGTAPKAGCAQ